MEGHYLLEQLYAQGASEQRKWDDKRVYSEASMRVVVVAERGCIVLEARMSAEPACRECMAMGRRMRLYAR